MSLVRHYLKIQIWARISTAGPEHKGDAFLGAPRLPLPSPFIQYPRNAPSSLIKRASSVSIPSRHSDWRL